MALQLYEDDLNNEEVLSKKLITLAEIIVRKHFYASTADKDDLVSIGVLKAIRMIHSDNFRSDKGNLCTFLYTGMRNDIHNYLYHKNKFDTVDIDNTFDDGGKSDFYFEDEVAKIDYSLIHLVCMKFSRQFGNFIEDEIIKKLKYYGFIIDGYIESCSNEVKDVLVDEAYKDEVIQRALGLLFWELRQHEMCVMLQNGLD